MSLDIRKGDLVKATSRQNPEETATGRVQQVIHGDIPAVVTERFFLYAHGYDFELLERPVDQELLDGAVEVYKEKAKEVSPGYVFLADDAYYEANVKAVIEFVQAYHNRDSK